MKLKGRRQSKNVKVQEAKNRQNLIEDTRFMKEVIAQSNPRLTSKDPVSNQKQTMHDALSTVNPGNIPEKGRAKANMRTLRETAEPGTLSKSNKKIEHQKVHEIKLDY